MAKTAFLTRAYNAAAYLPESAGSVLAQTDGDFLYFLCDNGSTDGTREQILALAAQDSRVVPVLLDENSPMESMNLLLCRVYASGCRYFAVLDADDTYDPGFHAEAVTALQRTGAGLFLCGSRFFSGEDACGERRFPGDIALERPDFGAWFARLHVFLRAYWAKLFDLRVLRDPPLLLSRELFYGSDTIFALEAFARCSRLALSGRVLHAYRMHGASDTHRLSPGRFHDDVRQRELTAALVRQNGWETRENRLFLDRVFLNAYADTATLSLYERDRDALLAEIFTSPALREAWEALEAASAGWAERSRLARVAAAARIAAEQTKGGSS